MAKIEFGADLTSQDANDVFLLKTEDDTIIGIVSLQNGGDTNRHLVDLQEHIYTVGTIIGIVGENDPNALIYASTNYIQDGDNRKICVEKLDTQAKLNADNIAANLILIGNNATAIQAILDSVGSANGICPLDANTKIPSIYLPDVLLEYKGTWNADTNTPTLTDGTGELNDWYRVNVAGTQDLGSGSETYAVGDKVVHNGTIWEKWDTVESVISVFGRTGAIVAQSGDYTAAQIGLGNVTNDAQLKRSSADFDTFTEKPLPVDNDIVLIEDSADSFSKKKVKISSLTVGGGGSGSGVFNYITNPGAEDNLNGWTLYANSVAGVAPDDFGGATAGVTLTRNTTTPIFGGADFQLDKDAVNRQGQGVYFPFTLNNGDLGETLMLSIRTTLNTTAENDLSIYIVASNDGFTSDFLVISPDTPSLKDVKTSLKQMVMDGTRKDCRLCIHVSTVNASSYTFNYDTVTFNKQEVTVGMNYISTLPANLPNASTEIIKFEVKIEDTVDAYNPITGIFDVPISGWYGVATNIRWSDTFNATNTMALMIYHGSVQKANNSRSALGTGSFIHGFAVSAYFYAAEGDEISVRAFQDSGSSQPLDNFVGSNSMSIVRIK